MKSLFSGIGQILNRQRSQQHEADSLVIEANDFSVAGNGGYIVALKYALFVLFGFYNARLFITTVPGWEGYMTATFALAGEATALYCFNNYTRSTGNHKKALGVFALLLFAFSFTHASISYFRMESGDLSGPIRTYCERVAFPLLFGLLLLAAIIIPLCHWKAKVAAEQAEAQTKIETDRARLVGESAEMRNQATLERERLRHFRDEIELGNEYVGELKRFGKMKRDEKEALADIPEPIRSQIASQLGITLPAIGAGEPTESEPTQSKPVVRWQGGRIVDDPRGN